MRHDIAAPMHIAPTTERWRRGDVELVDHAIADQEGRPAQPWRYIDILAKLHRDSLISDEMREAGEDFRTDFQRGHLDELRAADMSRIPSGRIDGRDRSSLKGFIARERAKAAIVVLGGTRSLAGSCAWEVLGCEESLKDWSIKHGCYPQEARGVLRVCLDILARHYRKIG